ncbi:cytoplasmic protein [Shewanella sp. DW31]|uniref:cytoplasmic protein n=1 Tax=Shewanella sp. DW31 TaxID=2699422 RepID=UPI0018E33BC0|nr:cytoplasmic protein [Shewanella sp. DW31]MBI1676660.1 cytoplasmic protein [Shewanella sp. DW31]
MIKLKNLLEAIKAEHQITTQNELVALLSQNELLIQQIQTADAQYWVHFAKNTFDGWYCIRTPMLSTFHVYYQERGQNCWGEDVFTEQSAAIAAVIFMSGIW